MSTVKATYSGFVSHDGIPVLLSAGEEYDADHPLVEARPDLFDVPKKRPAPEESKQDTAKAEEPKAPESPTTEPAPKRGPGRPPKATAKKDDGG